ncbi:MAG: ribonuclease III [Clostridia bacterium]|jgi:ribonuclease-3|nr:ribonuclease III [Clostridia bacterium]MBQ4244692.1 ribonuclease III [Clostridia bacterium]
MSNALDLFQEKLGYKFNNIELLERALSHSSYANENGLPESNERLEFLGDSVLGFISAEYFFSTYKAQSEGSLTKHRAAAVCEKTLCTFSKELGIDKVIRLGKGETRTGGAERPSILADAFESVLAAVYLDGGIEPAKKIVLRFITREGIDEARRDYKTMLQEVVQKHPEEAVEYFVVDERGPDHDKEFTVEVHLNSNVIGSGTGRSKKLAEQAAAREALRLMGLKE